MGIVELDATLCYDRIIKTVGIIVLLIFRMGSHSARWFLSFLDSLKFHITINGKIGQQTFPYKGETYEDAGQGLIGAGGFWTGTDSTITKEYHKTSYPAIMADPQKDYTIVKDSTIFVDDLTLCATGGTNN